MSQQSKRKKGPPISLDDFDFNPSELDLKFSQNLITVLDGYRIHRTYDLGFVDKKIKEGELPRSFIKQWGAIRSVLHKFAAIGPKVPGVESWLNRKQYISFASMALLTIVAPILLLTWVFQWAFLQDFIVPLAIIAIAMVLTNFLASAWFNRKIAWEIHNYIEENSHLVDNERKHLQKWVQELIYHVARLMRKSGEDPDKKLIKFFNNDYSGIEVLKEPAGFRKHYVVKIKLTS
ncbi:MAG: hypothetical protein ACFFCX_08400 [Candidatus Sifarchaeia archaeon]